LFLSKTLSQPSLHILIFIEPIHYSSQGVREQTQELASWALGDSPRGRSGYTALHARSLSDSESDAIRQGEPTISDAGRTSFESARPDTIAEESTPEEEPYRAPTTSALTDLFQQAKKKPLPRVSFSTRTKPRPDIGAAPRISVDDEETGEADEYTALLSPRRTRESGPVLHDSHKPTGRWRIPKGLFLDFRHSAVDTWEQLKRPERWDVHAIFHITVGAISAVALGLLLNVLDALSYGKLLKKCDFAVCSYLLRHDFVSTW
jgi:SulP family sulfate permease